MGEVLLLLFFQEKKTLPSFRLSLLPLAVLLAAAGACDTLVIPPGVGVGSPGDITSLNPLITTNAYNIEAATDLFANLIWIDQNDRIDLSRSMAQKIEVLDDGRRYRVTLRPWSWSDGVPVTAADVLFTWKLILQLKDNYAMAGQGGVPNLVQSVTSAGPAEFEITLKRPVNSNWFELNGLPQFIPLPRHVWQNFSTDQLWEEQSNPALFQVVDGPFQLSEFKLGRSISFTPNPSYPLARSPFRRMVVKFIQSSGGELLGVSTGEVDIANLPHEAYDAGKSVPHARMVFLPPGFDYDYIGLNFHDPKAPFLKYLAVRQAIQDSIDQASLIADLWHGQGVQVWGPVPPVPDTYLSPAARAGHYPIGFDLKKAAALLDRAGYRPGPDGVRAKGGVRLEFTLLVLTGAATSLMISQMIQPYLRKSGIAMHIKMIDYGQLLAILSQRIAPWQAYLLESDPTPYPSGETQFETGAVQNFGGYSDPKMDRLIAASTDNPGLTDLYRFEDYTSAQVPIIFLPDAAPVELERDGISGIERIVSPGGEYNPQLITFNRKACHAAHAVYAR